MEWDYKTDFMIAGVGSMIGNSNFWQFPVFCHENGGGTFLFLYIICVFCLGIPMVVFECGASQYIGSMTKPFSFCHLFSGISIMCFMMCFLVLTYYVIIDAWALLYYFYSFTHPLPWSKCDEKWSTPLCNGNLEHVSFENCSGVLRPYSNGTCYDELSGKLYGLYNRTLAIKNGIIPVLPADDFMKYSSINFGRSSGISDLGRVQWNIAFCLGVLWTAVFLAHIRGAKSSSKILYVTVVIPLVILVAFTILGLTVEGSGRGVSHVLHPDASKIVSLKAWKDAAVQALISLSLGLNVWPYLASNNKFHRNIIFDVCIMVLVDTLTSFLSTIAVSSFMGSFAVRLNIPIDSAITRGRRLVFIFLPQEFTDIGFGRTCCLFYFFMFFCFGFSSQLVMFGSATTYLSLSFRIPTKSRTFFCAGLCFVFFLLGLCMTTPGGIYILQLMSDYSANWNCFVAFLLMLCALAIYGVNQFCEIIEKMIGPMPFCGIPTIYLHWYLIACWKVICPLISFAILIFFFVDYKPSRVDSYVLPPAANAFGWMMGVTTISSVFISMIWKVLHQEGSLKERILVLLKPHKHWLKVEKLPSEEKPVDETECDSMTEENLGKRRVTFASKVFRRLSSLKRFFTGEKFHKDISESDSRSETSHNTSTSETSGTSPSQSQTSSTLLTSDGASTETGISTEKSKRMKKKKKKKKKRKKRKKKKPMTNNEDEDIPKDLPYKSI